MRREVNFGFTLSEMLIAVSIVGIIVAITVPTVISHYQEKSFLTMLRKNYVELLQNLTVLQTEQYNKTFYDSRLILNGGSVDDTAGYFLTEFFDLTRDCGTDTQPCFADSYRSINNSTKHDFTCEDGYSVILKSGASMCIVPGNKGSVGNTPPRVYVDVNGIERPNIGGRDMFTFFIYDFDCIDDGRTSLYIGPTKIKDGTAENTRNMLFSTSCKNSYVGEGCFGKLLNENWKVNY